MTTKHNKPRCESCEALMINGVFCHETGCPDKWQNTKRECKECGGEFTSAYSDQHFCCDDCYATYYGIALENME